MKGSNERREKSMESFLLFAAPFIIVALAVGILFWWGARIPRQD